MTWLVSVCLAFRNFRRAGTAWNRSRTLMVVPGAHPMGCRGCTSPPCTRTRTPSTSSARRVVSSNRLTDAMEGSASPRNPSVLMCVRSSNERILLVACRWMASAASAGPIPCPSSFTTMLSTPPSRMVTVTDVAPASSAFSSSSFTTLAGRSTTSPAAIWSISASSSNRMRGSA
jgi:hypothetical protein